MYHGLAQSVLVGMSDEGWISAYMLMLIGLNSL